MKLSKKLKKKLKKNTAISLTSIALVATTLAVFKLAGISMPLNTKTTSLLAADTETGDGTINTSLSVRNTYIKVGETLDVDVMNYDTNTALADQKAFTWTSSNEDVATVDSNGKVKGLSVGHTTITAKDETTGLKAKAIINVYRNKQGAITVPQVEEGERFTVVLKEDGTVWSTGLNDKGQLGQGDTTNSNTLVQVKIDENTYLTNVRKIARSYAHTMALTTDGEVYTWGYNNNGQLGQGNTTNRLYATKVKGIGGEGYLEDIIDISIANSNAYAVNKNGDLFGWGQGGNYQLLGIATTYTPVKLEKWSNAISINSGNGTEGLMLTNGETWVWGINTCGSLGNGSTASSVTERCLANDINEIIFVDGSGYILKEDGTVWSSGYNNYGQLGLGDTTDRKTYTQVKFQDGTEVKAKTISAGKKNLQIMGKDGKVYVAGYNGYGQLSNGTTTTAKYPTVMLNSDGTEVTDAMLLASGGDSYQLPFNMGIIRTDGTIWLSGDNTYGQIGNASNASTKYLTKLGINNVDLNVRNEYIKIGDTLDVDVLEASEFNVFIQDVTQSDWTWTSSNEDVATVDNNGIVTGKSVGHTTITGYNSKTGLKAKAIINVYRNKQGAITTPQVEEGEGFTVVLKEDGTVWSTGLNDKGQLGQGDTTNRNTTVQVKIDENTYLTNVRKISSSYASTMALTTDGKVYAWGYNLSGELGQGDTTNRLYATKVKGINGEGYLEDIIDISIAHSDAHVVNKNGQLLGWGGGAYYQLFGVDHSYTPLKLEKISNAININSGRGTQGVILANGETWVWGQNAYGCLGTGSTADKVTERCLASDINEIKFVGNSGYYLKEDGTVWSSGYNGNGQLGLGDTTNRTTYTQVKYKDGTEVKAKTISAGQRNFQFIGEDGKVYVTGYNANGQISNGTTTAASYPTVMLNSDGTEVTDAMLLVAGGQAFYKNLPRNMSIIRTDGTIWLSGDNTYGQIGNASNMSTNYLTKLGINNVTLNVRNEYIKIGDTLDIDVLKASGFNVFIQDETKQSEWTWNSSNEDVATVDNNGIVTGKSVGHTTITGYNSKIGLKAKAIINVYRNKQGAITVPQVEEGEGFTIVLKEDGTVWSTGLNDKGQLGQGDTTNRNTPVQVKIDENTYLTNVIKIVSSYASTMALTTDGEVYAWGYNPSGELGQGDTTNRLYATKVKGINGEGYLEDIIDISIANSNAYAVNKNGQLLGWGAGAYYQLFGVDNSYTPLRLEKISNAININSGRGTQGAILANGETWVWGQNAYGCLGTGSTANSVTERCLASDINEIKFVGNSGYYLKEDGTVWSSGYNGNGQLGLGDTTNRTTYTQVKYKDGTEVKAKTISAGQRNFQFIGEDGKVYVTGYNANGQLSNGTTTAASYPTVMLNSDGTEVTDAMFLVSGGQAYYQNQPRNMAIVRKDGTVWLSGDNTYGQIGDASNISTTYLTKMGDAFLNYPEKAITIGVKKYKKINPLLFNMGDDMNVFENKNSTIGTLTYTAEDTSIAEVDELGMIKGISQGFTRIKVTESNTNLTTNILVKVVEDGNIKIDLGNRFTVALKQDGSVWSWGQNHVGQLGLGNTTYYYEPQKITGITEKIVDVKSGYYHSIALTENGEVYTWGYNYHGQCGNGNTANVLTPVKIDGLSDIVKIDANKYMTIALTRNGEVYVWGRRIRS